MPRIPQKQPHPLWQAKVKGELHTSAMAKRRAGEDLSSLHSSAMETTGDGHDGGHGVDTLPNVPVNFVPNQDQYRTVNRTVKSAGTFWIRNTNTAGLFGANLWSEFPWEFMNIHIDQAIAHELYTTYKLWKPKSVKVKFMNPNMFIDMSTDTNPIMSSVVQGEVASLLDLSFLNSGPSSAIWGRASTDTNADTVAESQSIIQSWKSSGYTSNTATDIIQFLPVQAESTSTAYIRANHPDSKLIGIGNGQEVEHSWNYQAPYWRYTSEFIYSPVFAVSTFTTPNDVRAFGIRTDYLGGTVTPGQANTNQQIAAIIGPSQNTPAAGVPTLGAPFNSTTPTGVTNTNSLPVIDTHPQPPLLLHLKPHAQAFTGVGQTVCQIDFEIEYDIIFKDEAPRSGRAQAATSTLTLQSNPTLFPAVFSPWIVTPIGV